jgi:flagellar protein FlaJ
MEVPREAAKIFYPLAETITPYFLGLKVDLKRAGMKTSVQEYLGKGVLLMFLIFFIGLPLFSFIFAFLFRNFLFGFISSFTFILSFLAIFFLVYLNYPKIKISGKSKKIDNQIAFATVHLSTIASSGVPLDKIFGIFSKYSTYGETTDEIRKINSDMTMFGLDVNTALERAVDRSPSKSLKELLWGILSTNLTGGNLGIFLREKATSFMSDYKRQIHDFSHQLSLYLEIYLTAVILGAVFFVILTSIVAGIAGVTSSVLLMQFFLIFIFLPAISLIFIYLIKIATPGGE